MKHYKNPLNDETIKGLTDGLTDVIGQARKIVNDVLLDEEIESKLTTEQKDIFKEAKVFVNEIEISDNDRVQEQLKKVLEMAKKQGINIQL